MVKEGLREEIGSECDFKDESKRRLLQEGESVSAGVQVTENYFPDLPTYSTFFSRHLPLLGIHRVTLAKFWERIQ